MKWLAVVLVLAACEKSDRTSSAAPPRMERRELPGMLFELPAGVETTSELGYSAGRIARSVQGRTGNVDVRWSFGPEAVEDMPAIVRGIAKGMGTNPDDVHEVKGGRRGDVRARPGEPGPDHVVSLRWPQRDADHARHRRAPPRGDR